EALLALSPLHLPQTSWLTRFTFAATRSTVTSLPGGQIGPSLGNEVVAEGHSPSVIQVIDTAADPVDTTYIEVNPSFRVSLFNELVHHQFRFAFLLDWQQGGRINNISKLLYDFSQNTRDYADPIPGSNSTIGELRLSGAPPDTAYLESASFLKLREVTLSYELPGSAVRALWGSVRHATVSLSARNLFTITGYSGLDPEVSNFGNTAISRLWDIAPFPPSRSFWLTVVLGL
ncbi:MAG TPA: hypothetical protein VFX42_10945, partial [Gemmatimonadales bacterium]|nr:hypothetical protein [Gemmatimonadales bacterium]